MRVSWLSYSRQLFFGTLFSRQRILFKAIVRQIIVNLSRMGDQLFHLSFFNLWSGMCPIRHLHYFLLAPSCGAHIQEWLIKLLANLICREVHILAMLHHVIKRLLLWNESLGRLRWGSGTRARLWSITTSTFLAITRWPLLIWARFISLLVIIQILLLHSTLKVAYLLDQILLHQLLIVQLLPFLQLTIGCSLRFRRLTGPFVLISILLLLLLSFQILILLI